MVPPQQPPPDAYPFPAGQSGQQVHLIPDLSNYGKGPPRGEQGFFDFDVEQYYRQNQNDNNEESIQPVRHSTWY